MKRLGVAVVLVLGSVFPMVTSDPVSADAEVPIVRPLEVLNGLTNPRPSDGYGVYFDSNTSWAMSSLTFSPYPVPVNGVQDVSMWDWSLCPAVNDPACAPGTNNFLTATSILGTCMNEAEIGCIEGISVKLGDSLNTPLTKVRSIGAETVFEEDTALSIPRGSSSSLWESPGAGRFVVTSYVKTSYLSTANSWRAETPYFSLQIERIGATAEPSPGEIGISPSHIYPGKHLVTGSGTLHTPIKFAANTTFSVKVRLPNSVKGWFQARLKNGVVGTVSQTSKSTIYEISGEATPVIIAGGAVRLSDLPVDFMTKLYGSAAVFYPPGVTLGPVDPGNGSRSLVEYNGWSQYLGDKALTTIGEWNVKSSGWPVSNGCFSQLTGVTGMLATNAAAYEGSPPAWDPATGSLDYKVAAPHFDENGVVNSGTYTLAMVAAAARCLYGASELPAKVEIAVGYSDSGADQVSSQALSENKGWLNFSAFGFHYSTPTIRLKLGRPPSAPVADSSPVTVPQVSATVTSTTLPAPASVPSVIQPVAVRSLLPQSAGTAVSIRRAPSRSMATDSAVAVSGAKVSVALRAPSVSSVKDSVVRYVFNLKPLTKGARSIVKSMSARSGAVSTASLVGSRKSRYQVLVNSLTKSGKSIRWTGPTLTTG